jgi:hypothetical protein
MSLISAELAAFIEAGVSILVGSRDAGLAPDCLRAIGARVEGADEITVFLPAETARTTVANLLDNGRIAVCFSQIADHRTHQLKVGCSPSPWPANQAAPPSTDIAGRSLRNWRRSACRRT